MQPLTPLTLVYTVGLQKQSSNQTRATWTSLRLRVMNR